MLATQTLPALSFSASSRTDETPSQYRPAKDIESFNALLPPPVEFIEGSSSGALAVAEGKYEPINVPTGNGVQSPNVQVRNSYPVIL
jgi:ubiquitin carboxyl-terminal hydrolase 36/42